METWRKELYFNNIYQTFIMHHGILGQKWGIRRKRIPLNLQFFGSHRAKDLKFKFRNKQEAAIVTKAFHPNNLSREQMKMKILSKSVNIDKQGAWVYTAKNMDGNGTFKVFKRTRIKDSATGVLERNKYE